MEYFNRRRVLGLSLAALAPCARAQGDWPSKPILLILGFPAGGPNDLVARAMSQRLTEQLKQQIVVDNRPGANGNIAAAAVGRAAPDGYTYLYNSSALALSAAMSRKAPIEPLRDLVPVNGTATLPLVCVVEASFPANNFREWVAQIKANPGRFNYGSPGAGNLAHLAPAMVLKAQGLEAVHVPYKGSSEAMQALIGGSIQFQFDAVNSPLAMIKAGRLKPLFVTSAQRSPALPDVPTLGESGARNIEFGAWQGIMAPAKTPPVLINRMAAEITRAMNSPEMYLMLTIERGWSPREYQQFLASSLHRLLLA